MSNSKIFEYITDYYYSNCLLEAIKAKLKNHNIKIYYCKPIIKKNKFQCFHFMWEDGCYSYDFSDCEEQHLSWYKCLFFRGRIRKFEKTFAERYSNYRNKKRGVF
jgi:hypothetical protein